MCVGGDILDSRIWENYKTNIFHIFYVDLRLKLVLCMNMWEQYEHLSISGTFKHIQGI